MSEDNVDEKYAAAWKDYQFRWRLSWFLFLGYLPLGGGMGILLSSVFHSEIPFIIIGGTWFLSIPISEIYRLAFRCPRCHKLFFLSWNFSYQNPFKQRCDHCGLAAYASHDSGNVERDIAEEKKRSKARLKKSLWIGIPIVLLLHAAIGMAVYIGQKRLEKPREIAEQFLKHMQVREYQQAHQLLNAQGKNKLKIQTLKQQWQTVEKAQGVTATARWLGAGSWPGKNATLHYEIPGSKGGSGGAKFEMVSVDDQWKIVSVILYPDKDKMFQTGAP